MNRLAARLALAVLCAAWIAIAAMLFVVQRTVDAGFRDYVTARAAASTESSADQLARLEAYYAANGTWAGAEAVLGRGSGGGRGAGGGAGSGGAVIAIADQGGVIRAAADPALIGTPLDQPALAAALPLTAEGLTVGWLARLSPGIQALGAAEVAFLEEANRWLTLAALGSSGLALVVGVIFAWTLARPLRELTAAARDLSIGQVGRQVQVRGTVEIETLASEFNRMSLALAEAEALRQRMAADVAHELRTPVSVLRGHLEAMLDGVYPLDSVHIASAHDQTIHLARLVEDLRVLTLAEAKRLPLDRGMIAPGTLVTDMIEAFEPLILDGEWHFTQRIAPDLPSVHGDVTRIRQVLSNLLANAARYTPAGGSITVEVCRDVDSVRFSVINTVIPHSLPPTDVFQPFWRGPDAHTRAASGSGLGLAISREIVRLHGGRMWVDTEGDWAAFRFTLPTRNPHRDDPPMVSAP